ncbi:MAG TPA: hypothetical protein VER55_09330 [Ardenticatenaceae bacterium]|nr:hypothetical protein [Ardenticatenaceae bacterium]
MDDLAVAVELTGLDEKWLQPFDVADPFNVGRQLQGFLSLRPDHRYGALAMTRVDGEPAPQLVYTTPKLHYPFGRDGQFHFPPIRSVTIYEKLDGTNVCAYAYRDAAGQSFITYKLRLYPVLRNSRWGDFLDLWGEMLERYPAIPDLVPRNGCAISFELYGNRNPHLVAYAHDLDVAVLFGVRADASVVPPHEIDHAPVPGAPLLGVLKAGEDPVARYGALRAELERQNRPADEQRLAGSEGAVWYVTEPSGRVTLFKLKPESVEAIHWATGINKAAVMATCWNLLETSDWLTFDTLEQLLLEDYNQAEIEGFRDHIERCLEEVRDEVVFRDRVLAAYADTGVSWEEDKAAVMRALSTQFERREMKKVYTLLARNASR